MESKKPIKKNHIKEFGGRMPRRRPRDKLETSQGHLGHLGLIYVLINTKGTECPRDRRDISRDRWDVSPGHTGHTPGGVPPKFSMFIGFFFFPNLRLSRSGESPNPFWQPR